MSALDSVRDVGRDPGPLTCVGGFLFGIVASTLLIASVEGPLKLAGIGFIFAGLGACLFVLEDERTSGEPEGGPP